MSDPTAPSSNPSPSPMPGCFLFVVGLLVFSTMAIWAVYSLVKQSQAISTFTSPTSEALPTPSIDAAQSTAINDRLRQFENEVWAGTGPTLTLSATELNYLIEKAPAFASVRNTIRVQTTALDDLTFLVSLPINALPWEPKRYLNGQIKAKPGVLPDKGLTLETTTIEVPGKTVTPEFIRNYQAGRFLDIMLVKSFREDPRFGPLVLKIAEATWQQGQLTLKASLGPAQKLPD